MTHEIIDACQVCGHYIEPVPIPGTGRALVFCQRDECLARRFPVKPMPLLDHQSEPWIPLTVWAAAMPVINTGKWGLIAHVD